MILFKVLKLVLNHPLNRHNKKHALLRFLKWQIASRLFNEQFIVNWVNNTKFIVKSGDTGMTGNIYCGLLEFQEMSFVLHALSDGDLFIDVGANAGSFTILAGSKGAEVISFEPVKTTFQKLKDNVRVNYLERKVSCLNAGVSNENGPLIFSNEKIDTINHVVEKGNSSQNTVQVDAVTLDNALSGKKPFMLKIDVEGYEKKVIEGAKEILLNPMLHCVIMEVNGSGKRYGIDESDILKTMREYGFSINTYDPLNRKLIKLENTTTKKENIIFTRNENEIESRIKRSPKITINNITF